VRATLSRFPGLTHGPTPRTCARPRPSAVPARNICSAWQLPYDALLQLDWASHAACQKYGTACRAADSGLGTHGWIATCREDEAAPEARQDGDGDGHQLCEGHRHQDPTPKSGSLIQSHCGVQVQAKRCSAGVPSLLHPKSSTANTLHAGLPCMEASVSNTTHE
jgi:hypothetical protein